MSGDAARIRPATPVDRHAVADLWLELVDHHRALDPGYRVAAGLREAVLGELARGMASPACRVVVAELGSELVGFAFCERAGQTGLDDPDVGWVHELFVRPAYRGRGLGGALADAAAEFLRGAGAGRLAVRVEEHNAAARDFWAARGYRPRARLLEREL